MKAESRKQKANPIPPSPSKSPTAGNPPKWDPKQFLHPTTKSPSSAPLPAPPLAAWLGGPTIPPEDATALPKSAIRNPQSAIKARLSLASLTRECRSDRESVRRWVEAAGYDPLNLKPEDHDVLIRIIQEHQTTSTAGMPGKKAARDNDGLTWLEAVQKQDARRKKRENDIADKVLKEEWVSASAHHQILANLTAKMETAPDKIKTELGLTIAQRDRIQKILDELRFDAAAETRRTFIAAKKQVEDAKTA